jgi:DNA-binding NarL/FixJ family response regulator
MGTRILIADDHCAIRAALRGIIEGCADLEVVGEAENGLIAVQMARDLLPDVVVMDITMPVMDGIEATRRIVGERLGAKVVAVSFHDDRNHVAGMLGAGAVAYVLKDRLVGQLVKAIRGSTEGRTYLCPEAAAVMSDGHEETSHLSGQG